MVSSTFTDLEDHRAALIAAIHRHKVHANVMEYNDASLTGDVIESSLEMVRESAAYICVISQKYGHTPECAVRNPNKLSLTELEFNEAQRLRLPTLLFIMGEDHLLKPNSIERDPTNLEKLNNFRERAKKWSDSSSVNRVYATFDTVEAFKEKIASPLAKLCKIFDAAPGNFLVDSSLPKVLDDSSPIPKPPSFYAEPDYIGSHRFVGRDSQLQELSDWANRSDPTNVLLFEAIGGNGKSMLTWEWTTRYAVLARPDWAGRFWYSFYEHGAVLADFLQRGFAYMAGLPLEEAKKKSIGELKEGVIGHLHSKPWLLILDGLERVLVTYHRIDSAAIPDEEANSPTDKVLQRNPCDTILDSDGDLLRALAAAAPSKILISSRLTPRVLLNPSGQTITGVRRIILSGLRPLDAEELLKSCGISGDSAAIQNYLQQHCDNHPLTVGVLAGLIKNYLPDRGNFDAWVVDRNGGAKLDLARLDLVQRRNHILYAAIDALPSESAQLLSTLALLSDAVDAGTLYALSPFSSPTNHELTAAVTDLESRGLLQYDASAHRYDLHPVVRAVAAGRLPPKDKEIIGQRVVDHFTSQPRGSWETAKSLDDVANGLNVVRTLAKLGRLKEAARSYRGELATTLLFNIEAQTETLSLLQPFFPNGWGELPLGVDDEDVSYLANSAANALRFCGEDFAALAAYAAALRFDIERNHWKNANGRLRNIAHTLTGQTKLAIARRIRLLDLELAEKRADPEAQFLSRLSLFADYGRVGEHATAAGAWRDLARFGRDWPRAVYRQGNAEFLFAHWHWLQGTLEEEHLATATKLAESDGNRVTLRELQRLRGNWKIEQNEWDLAATAFHEAVTMARGRRLVDTASETGLALAKFKIGQLDEPKAETLRLAQLHNPNFRVLAQLWQALGDDAQAKRNALAAYRWSWGEGEPYVRRFELTKSAHLLQELNVQVPALPPFDPATSEKLPWEDEVTAAIREL